MKTLILSLLALIGFMANGYAQNLKLSPVTLPAQGQHTKAGNFALSWTMGQVVNLSARNGNLSLTQGFQQVEIPKAPASLMAKRICSDTPQTITFRNVTSGAGGNRIEWALNSSFTGSHLINSGDSITLTVNSGNVDTIWLRSRIGATGCVSTTLITTASVLPPISIFNKITVTNDICGTIDTVHVGSIDSVGTNNFKWQYSPNGSDFIDLEGVNTVEMDLERSSEPRWYRRLVYQNGHCDKISNKIKIQ